jgi:hypothetical protein
MVLTSGGAIRRVDACMRSLVQFVNDAGIQTFDSCCGHGLGAGHVTIRSEDAARAVAMGFRLSSLGTRTIRRVSSAMRSNGVGSGLGAGALGVSVIASSFCRASASAWSVGHVVAGSISAPISFS